MSKCIYEKELHWHVKKCDEHNIWPCFKCMAIIPTPPKSERELE